MSLNFSAPGIQLRGEAPTNNKKLSTSSAERGPVVASIIWKRHDLPGHETCRLLARETGWRLSGVSVFLYEGKACLLDYEVDCDSQWITRSAVVTGWVGDRSIYWAAECDEGRWQLNGQRGEVAKGSVDIDLNFSPSTNLLPIRRLRLAVGATETLRAAWLRFPTFSLEPLEQSYTRLSERQFQYQSAGFAADLTVDDEGLVIDYGSLWSRESGGASKQDAELKTVSADSTSTARTGPRGPYKRSR